VVWGRIPRLLRRWIVRLAAPSFTVGAACVIERGDGSVLLVRLTYRDRWGLPGGLIKRNEDVGVCARREVEEEIGLDVVLTSEPAVVVDSRPQRIDVVFRARPAAGVDPDDAHARSAEILEARWFPADELPPLQHEAISALMALAASALGPAPDGAGDAGGGDDDGAPPGGRGARGQGEADRTAALSDGVALRRAAAVAAGQRRAADGGATRGQGL
jgi:8-oxo-dGTP diphosphatase